MADRPVPAPPPGPGSGSSGSSSEASAAAAAAAGAPPPPPPRGEARRAPTLRAPGTGLISGSSSSSGSMLGRPNAGLSNSVQVPLPAPPAPVGSGPGPAPSQQQQQHQQSMFQKPNKAQHQPQLQYGPPPPVPARSSAAAPQPAGQNAGANGAHALSLKVMRISQPTLATLDRPYFEGGRRRSRSSSSSSGHATADPGAVDPLDYDAAHEAFFFAAADEEAQAQEGEESGADAASDRDALWSALDPEMTVEEINELIRFGAQNYPASAPSTSTSTSTAHQPSPARTTLRSVHDALLRSAQEDWAVNEHAPGAHAAEGPSASREKSKGKTISTMRDWPLSDLLTLPASFGTVYLGECFSAFVCVNNEAHGAVAGVSLRVEMQYGPGAAGGEAAAVAAAGGQQETYTAVLAHVHYGQVPGSRADEPGPAVRNSSLPPGRKLETTVKHEVTQTGPHVLICTVTYYVALPGGNASSLAASYAALGSDGSSEPQHQQRQHEQQQSFSEQSFRKFYRFSVADCPLGVRTKSHVATLARDKYHASHYLRDRLLLEVQLSNQLPTGVGAEAIVLEDVEIIIISSSGGGGGAHEDQGWCWRRVDRPERRSENWKKELDEVVPARKALRSGEPEHEILLPGDIIQVLFEMFPASSTAQYALPPLSPTRRPGLPARSTQPLAIMGQKALEPAPVLEARQAAAPASAEHLKASAHPFVISSPLGKIAVRWRSAMGEAGNLQTSTLVQQFQYPAPIFCSPAAARLAAPSDAQGASSRDSVPQAPLLLQCQVRVLELPDDAVMLEPFKIKYQVWVRDVQLARAGTSQPAEPTEELDSDDDDTPLSEMAKSPRGSLSNGGAGPSPAESQGKSTAQTDVAAHWIRLAVQYTRPSFVASVPDELNAALTTSFQSPAANVGTPIKSGPSRMQPGYVARSGTESSPMTPTPSEAPTFLARAISPLPGSRPGTPVKGGNVPPSLIQAGRVPTPVPPPPPAKNEIAKAARYPLIPSPLIPVTSETTSTPDDAVRKLGNSLQFLPPLRLASSSASDTDGPVIAGEAVADFTASYFSQVHGLAKIGGLRVYLMGWWSDQEQASRTSETQEDDPGCRLAEPVLVKNLGLATLADLYIGNLVTPR